MGRLQLCTALLLPLLCSAACPSGFQYEAFFNKCYKYVNQSTNFLAAEQYCNSYGGHLTAVHSPVENAYVATLGNSNAGQSHKTWIGLNLLMSESFSWTTSESLDYVSAWALGFPSVPSYYQCVSVSSDTTWSQQYCNSNHTFVCQSEPDAPASLCPTAAPVTQPTSCVTPTTSPNAKAKCADVVCPRGYVMYPNNCQCYKYDCTDRNWADAVAYCATQNATLAKVDSDDLNNFLFNYIESKPLLCSYYSCPFIGLSCSTNSTSSCYWNDGTPLQNPIDFYIDSPNGGPYTVLLDSVFINGTSLQGKWFTTDDGYSAVMCETKAVPWSDWYNTRFSPYGTAANDLKVHIVHK